MARPIDSLPKEYRTASLESLPKDLQARAVSMIQKRFGLKKAETAEANGSAFEDMYSRMNNTFLPRIEDMMVNPKAVFIDPYETSQRRRFRVHVDGRNVCKNVQVDVSEDEYQRGGKALIERLAVGQLAYAGFPVTGELLRFDING